MDLLHGFEVLSTTEETLFNSRNVSRLVHNKHKNDSRFHPDIVKWLKVLTYGSLKACYIQYDLT